MEQQLNSKKLWDAVLAELQINLSELNFKTWVASTRADKFENDSLTIICPNHYSREKLQTSLRSMIESSVNKIAKKNIQLNFIIGDTTSNSEKPSQKIGPLFNGSDNPNVISLGNSAFQSNSFQKSTKAPIEISQELKSTARISPNLTFETYITGSNNRLAYAIAVAVTENPGTAYNPFFIYSGVGLGKTHLLHAIGNKIIEDKPKLKVIYTTGESFMNELIEAIQSGRGRGKYNTNKFRNKYRKADVLLIDDVQFIAGRESTQEEFFHTFNALYMSQKQIVLTSDRPPKDFKNLEDRITSRFSSGIIADIQAPDIDTRVAILRNKKNQSGDEISNQTIDTIAELVDTNIRELEGAYLQVITFAKATGEIPTPEVARQALGKNIKPKSNKPVNLNQILKAVCNYYSIRLTDIKGKRRTKEIVIPRQMAMYLIHDLTETPYMSIGEVLGGRDHTTIMHGVRKIEEESRNSPKLKQDLVNIKNYLDNV